MFCYQCEQAAKGEGCTKVGVCGKQPDVAALQDLLTYALKGLGEVATEARKLGIEDRETNVLTNAALFSTLTNVNFDPKRFPPLIHRTVAMREALKEKIREKGGNVEFTSDAANFTPAEDLKELVKQGEEHGFLSNGDEDPDIRSLKHTLIFSLRGIAAYAYHAETLGKEDPEIYKFVHGALAFTLKKGVSLEEAVEIVLQSGRVNLRTMEILDAAHTETYGHPVPTKVPLGHKKGKAILVSGHDLKDLDELLKQTEGKGIWIYTHGEMLPTHGYPELKKYPHFYGHYGTAWQNQQKEFAQFPGAILMTTNCIQKPRENYENNIFTCGLVGWPGVTHIEGHDYEAVIRRALELPGFAEDSNGKHVMVGFGRNALLSVADKIVEAVKAGKIRHFFLVGGCDGAKPSRNYYTRFVEMVPEDCIVLTLACGKFRFFDKDLGTIGDLPGLIDIGQCNDAYSAIQVAAALAKAFQCDVNELPLSIILSWYEQKAVAILLTLLSLGIKNIRLGPTLPAFISPNVLNYLVEKYQIKPISTPEEDLKAILG
ncbi:MAG: hydroxylamine reductase [Deltaproteobacteria bacterium]|nr:hydroxylamine reductase [Deltaproteobacteria bacterium]MBW2069185.1 hydroxylamine reductase [Deltaproteobacteria bacterium]